MDSPPFIWRWNQLRSPREGHGGMAHWVPQLGIGLLPQKPTNGELNLDVAVAGLPETTPTDLPVAPLAGDDLAGHLKNRLLVKLGTVDLAAADLPRRTTKSTRRDDDLEVHRIDGVGVVATPSNNTLELLEDLMNLGDLACREGPRCCHVVRVLGRIQVERRSAGVTRQLRRVVDVCPVAETPVISRVGLGHVVDSLMELSDQVGEHGGHITLVSNPKSTTLHGLDDSSRQSGARGPTVVASCHAFHSFLVTTASYHQDYARRTAGEAAFRLHNGLRCGYDELW